MKCEHKDFSAEVDVSRLEDTGRFMADVRIKCADCGLPFRFIGLPCGVDVNGAAVNINGQEAHLSIAPHNEVRSVLDDGGDVGFTVRRGLSK